MSKLSSVNFTPLAIFGSNYLPWTLDTEMYLQSEGLENCIVEGNAESKRNKASALVKLRHHLHEDLKHEYQSVKDPYELWINLAKRYGHQKDTLLPQARYEWLNLRIQDFKTVTEYNSAVHRITSTMKMCRETVTENDMLEKTLSTFSATDILLQQQYRNRGFTEHSDLITYLLVAEQNNELLLKNNNRRPAGTQPLPEVNHTGYGERTHNKGSYRRRGYNSYRGRGRYGKRGRGRGGRGSGRNGNNYHESKNYNNEQSQGNSKAQKPHPNKGKNQKNYMNGPCNRCGNMGHYAKDCKSSLKTMNEYKNGSTHPEAHFAFGNDPHQKFDSLDFMENDDLLDSLDSHHVMSE